MQISASNLLAAGQLPLQQARPTVPAQAKAATSPAAMTANGTSQPPPPSPTAPGSLLDIRI